MMAAPPIGPSPPRQPTLLKFVSRRQAAAALVARVMADLEQALARRGAASLAAPGGTTPGEFLALLAGFAAGTRMTAELSVTFDMRNETFGKVVRSRKFEGLNPEILLGAVSGRYLKITAPKWVTNAAPIDVPENGTTPVTLTGNLFQSKAGGKDPIKLRFG